MSHFPAPPSRFDGTPPIRRSVPDDGLSPWTPPARPFVSRARLPGQPSVWPTILGTIFILAVSAWLWWVTT